MKVDKDSIRRTALELIAEDPRSVGSRLAAACGLSRQVANGYLQRLIRDGLVTADGSTRARTYRLAPLEEAEAVFDREGLEEHRVWREFFSPRLGGLPRNVLDIWHYALTEMINNAIDHSGGREVRVGLSRNALFTACRVADDGEGIFGKIQRAFGLSDPREAILELVKGKVTTAPENHTGEGIFFTSRAVDRFELESGRLRFRHAEGAPDVLEELEEERPGTVVRLRLDNGSPRDLGEVFDRFADSEEFTFDRTIVPLRLAQFEGQGLVSRSQARRIAHRLERFKRVELDFDGVESIGQAFADELFRVFAQDHPEVRLVPVNVSPAVDRMIRRAVAARTEGGNDHGHQ